MYECVICLSLNHASRLHCQACGTVPKQYSCFNKEYVAPDVNPDILSDAYCFRPIVAAKGCDRVERHHNTRVNLKTVALDYYASNE